MLEDEEEAASSIISWLEAIAHTLMAGIQLPEHFFAWSYHVLHVASYGALASGFHGALFGFNGAYLLLTVLSIIGWVVYHE